jgi:dGTPase
MRLSKWACPDMQAIRKISIPDEQKSRLLRSPYLRDKDRILYSKPFRRLAYKTQVFVTSDTNSAFDEHCRTRLTHTLEVAQIARTIASTLKLNVDLAEAIAYGHDVGHTPFGHAGERVLNDFLQGKYVIPHSISLRIKNLKRLVSALNDGVLKQQFKHNYQSVRILSELTNYCVYDRGCGLNLTYQTLAGILKHTDFIKNDNKYIYPDSSNDLFEILIYEKAVQSLETVIVAMSDEIAQVVHDLCDALKTGYVSKKDLLDSDVSHILHKSKCLALRRNNNIGDESEPTNDEFISQICSRLINYFTFYTIIYLKTILSKYRTKSDLIDALPFMKIPPSPIEEFRALKTFKNNLIINNYHVNRMDNKGSFIIKKLIDAYISDPRQLPDSYLDQYIKTKTTHNYNVNYFQNWFYKRAHFYSIQPLSPNDVKICYENMFSPQAADKHRFRKAPSTILDLITPYLICDVDYRRTVVDCIANMTDNFAEHEYKQLYR